MTIKIEINKCYECRHTSHSGAYTPGGPIYICRHPFAPKHGGNPEWRWQDITTEERAKLVFGPVELPKSGIPEWCPLKKGYSYE